MLLKFILQQRKEVLGLGSVFHSNWIHTSASCCAVQTSLLSKLRKKTGFSISNCKNALEKFSNDIDQAEKWLKEQAQKEGWAKATKLQGRAMSAGLIGLMVEGKAAAMVEINCETDFVARNERFLNVVSKTAAACLHHGAKTQESKIVYDKQSFAQIPVDEGTVADCMALEIGNLRENMAARRAVYMNSGDKAHTAYYIHAAGTKMIEGSRCMVGKYGAMMLLEQVSKPLDKDLPPLKVLGQKLCTHVVAMNPKTIGTLEDLQSSSDSESSSGEESGSDSSDSDSEERDETVLLKQEFMADQAFTVGEMVQDAGINIIDFVRFECGEDLGDNNQENKES